MAKGQQKSNREKKKPKQDKKAPPPPSASPFGVSGPPGNPSQKGVSAADVSQKRAEESLLRRRV